MASARPHSESPTTAAASASSERDETACFFLGEKAAILEAAAASLRRSRVRRYCAEDPEEVSSRLERLYDELAAAAAAGRDLTDIVGFAQGLARARFSAGYDLSEIQAAVNALEEAIWLRIFATLPPERFERALALTGTILGAAKDALACEYVSLATRTRTRSLDLGALFAGPGPA